MKTPRPAKAEQSAPNSANFTVPGGFPARKNTVTADTLAKLLSGYKLTGIESVFSSSTTRLGAFVHRLTDEYDWQIERADKAQGCADGRVSWVKEYWFDPELIARAMAAGAAGWCEEVHAARRARRAKAAEARRKADRANAARKTRPHPGQWGFFEGVVA